MNKFACGYGQVVRFLPVEGTFPSVWVSHLVTTAEEGRRVVLANQTGMENIAVCDDHPQGGMAYDSCYS